MQIQGPSMTARDAANYFAENAFEEPRKVGTIIAAPDAAMKFQLVNGVQWYAVRILPDYSGWEVTAEMIPA